jgi:hypothetical protein
MKRYADTGALVSEFVAHSPTDPRTLDAIARMNYLHRGYRMSGGILDDDMLYTLSLFALEPVKWISTYEWRQLTDLEKCAIGTFWKSMGDAMQISYEHLPGSKTGFRDGLQWLEEIMAWSRAYEVEKMVPDQNNRDTATQTTAVLLWTLPDFLKPVGLKAVIFLMDDRLRRSMM